MIHLRAENCGSCLYWNRKAGEPYGACRRRSPAHVTGQIAPAASTRAIWPVTQSDDWCGDSLCKGGA